MSGYQGSRAPAFIKSKALYIVPHQDDELLTAGGAITSEVQHGRDVHVLLATDGMDDPVRWDGRMDAVLGYAPSAQEFAVHRDKEFVHAVRRMGATPIVPAREERQPDGAATPQGVAQLVRAHAFDGAALRATSNYDYHPDHRSCGWALMSLAKDGFGHDPRLMIGDYKRMLMPKLARHHTMGHARSVTEDHAWPYVHQDPPEWWGIGAMSVPGWFEHTRFVDSTTHWHRPLPAPLRLFTKGGAVRALADRVRGRA